MSAFNEPQHSISQQRERRIFYYFTPMPRALKAADGERLLILSINK